MKSEKTTAGINPAELRIGNYLNYGNYLVRVVEIKKTVFMVEYPNYENANTMQSEHDNFEPIHLSEEWLIWFGFTKNKLSMYLCLPNDNDECKPFFNKDSLSKYTQLLQSNDLLPISTFQYVHQLQNIYFALTGEELTIKN